MVIYFIFYFVLYQFSLIISLDYNKLTSSFCTTTILVKIEETSYSSLIPIL